MRTTVLAWMLLAAGVAVVLAADYRLRLAEGGLYTGGLSEPVYSGIPTLLGVVAAWLLWRGSAPLGVVWKRTLAVAGQAALGFVLYAVAVFAYAIGTGIDAL